MITKQYNIITSTGFARPATLLVQVSRLFTSRISLEYQKKSIDLKYSTDSIMDILSLRIRPYSMINIKAEGIDEYDALQTIDNLFNKNKLIIDQTEFLSCKSNPK
ncbi:HPr family phosphocarrier protein [Peribacillus deserti]|nr:HPr family phosphocarrier protein [Peribacillus deserti]